MKIKLNLRCRSVLCSLNRTAFALRLLSIVVLLSLLSNPLMSIATVSASTNVWTSNGPEGGTILALAIDPTTPTTLYAGTDGGGMFKSTNGGESWSAINIGLTASTIFALAIDPVTPATLYVGTWDGGIFKSTNGGGNWNPANTGLIVSMVHALAIDPVTPSTLYAGTNDSGVFKSTNGGETWSTVNAGLTAITVQSLAIDPAMPTTLYTGTYNGGVFKSSNGGGSWSAVNTGLTYTNSYIQSLTIDSVTPTTLYAGTSGGVFKSTNEGVNWSAANTGLTEHTDVRSLVIDPATPTTLYAGTYDGAFKSTNGGVNWNEINTGLINIQNDASIVYALAIDSSMPTSLYAGTWVSGVFKSTNSGGNWNPVHSGLNASIVPALAIDPTTPTTLYAGTIGGGIFNSTNGGENWSAVNAGISSTWVNVLMIDPLTPATLYAGTYDNGVFKSTNGGENWVAVNTGLTNTNVHALAIDPITPTILYAGTEFFGVTLGGVFKTTNGGGSWSAINTDMPNTTVYALAVDPVTPTTLYAGTWGDGVFRSTDGGENWSPVNTGLANTYLWALVIDPLTPTTLYAGTNNAGVFKSTNSGGNWSAVNTGLTNTEVQALAIDPTTSTTLYAGTRRGGVFKSTDGGGNWNPLNVGSTAINIQALAINSATPNIIYAGTHGEGVSTFDNSAATCGSGTWTAGNLEIHHIDIGQGDSALIVGPTGKSLLLDAGEENYNSSAKAQIIGPYIEAVLGCKSIDYVLISHFHLDHIGYVGFGGLWHLVESQGFTVGTTLVRDYNSYLGDTSGTLTNWKTYLEGAGQSTLHPATAVEGTSQVDLGAGVTFDIVTVDGNGALIAGNFSGDASPPSENDYSIGAVLSYGNFDEWLGGDLDGQYETGGFGYTYHDIELSVTPEVGDVDVYKANHHGSSHSSSATFLNQLDPEVSVVSEGNGNSYGHPTQATMDRLLATSTVYLTERGELTTNIGSAIVAGNIVIKSSNGTAYTVNGTAYTATEPTRTDTDGDGYFAEADPDDNNTSLTPAPNGGCGAIYQTCSVSCEISAGQVLINEVLPAPSSGPEWVELYNTTNSTLNLGYCRIDDIAAGSPIYQIPAGTLIPAHGFWTLDRTTYFNNTGDDVRFLAEDGSTLLDSHTYGNTGSNLAWYRFPNGGAWALSATASTTKGQSNNTPFSPIVLSIARADTNPTSATSVGFTVTFSEAVTGVNTSTPFSDFALTTTGVTGTAVTSVSGSGATYTVTVNTGSGMGTIRLDVVDDDSIKDATNNPLGGVGIGNGNFTNGEIYNVIRNIMISGNAGVGGVTLSYTDNGPKTATANGSGNYSITVPYGWSGVVTPSKAGYTFSPVNRSYTNVPTNKTAQNYTAVPIRYTISGNVGASGITLNYTDGTPKTAISQANGNYSFTVSYNWSGTVTPSHACYTFNPVNRTYSNVIADQTAQNYTPTIKPGCANVVVGIAGTNQGTYGLAAQKSTRDSYAGVNAGPVQVVGTNAVPFLVAERDAWLLNGVVQSFSEMMGLPGNQVTDTYYFPWYNNVTMDTQLRFANLGNTSTNITVTIAGVPQPVIIPLAAGVSTRVSYPGINAGPVKVESSGNVPIIVAERDAWLINGVVQSFSEMMGLPGNQLTDTYYFPWYNNVTMDTQLRFANLGNVPTTINVTIAGTPQTPIPLAAGQSTRVSYAINNGPVKVQSTGGVPIIVAERDAWLINGVVRSFSEMMGLPGNQLTDTYHFPWYNNVTMDTQLRFANLGVAPTNITVTIAGVPQTPIPLAAGVSTRVSYAGINNGPVTVTSSGGVPIIVAERDAWLLNGAVRSFSEMMGLPGNQLATTYYFPWYNNLTMDTQLRFAVP